jgi:hypothetical protein
MQGGWLFQGIRANSLLVDSCAQKHQCTHAVMQLTLTTAPKSKLTSSLGQNSLHTAV